MQGTAPQITLYCLLRAAEQGLEVRLKGLWHLLLPCLPLDNQILEPASCVNRIVSVCTAQPHSGQVCLHNGGPARVVTPRGQQVNLCCCAYAHGCAQNADVSLCICCFKPRASRSSWPSAAGSRLCLSVSRWCLKQQMAECLDLCSRLVFPPSSGIAYTQ